MIGLIVGEYLPNTFFYHIYNNMLGHISVTYSLKSIPKALQSVAQVVCPDCKMVINANLTKYEYHPISLLFICIFFQVTSGIDRQKWNCFAARGRHWSRI